MSAEDRTGRGPLPTPRSEAMWTHAEGRATAADVAFNEARTIVRRAPSTSSTIATIVRPRLGRLEIHGLRRARGDEPRNRVMFREATGRAILPVWVAAPPGEPGWHGHWAIAREHLTDIAEAIALRDGRVRIEMHYSLSERCDSKCQDATGDDCSCSCEGRHHGEGNHAAWREVGATTLLRSERSKVVSRELTRQQALYHRRRRGDRR